FDRSSSTQTYYSDADVPLDASDWTPTGFTQTRTGNDCIAAGDYGYILLTLTRVARTEDGENYTVVYSSPGSIPNGNIFVTSQGSIITYGSGFSEIAVSHDKAVTFSVKETPGLGNVISVYEADGR